MIGERLGHYEIRDALGQGAMGAVYRAFDTRLRREVAIKVLTGPDLSSEEERERLLAEARAAAPLNHPAIATIFEVGSEGEASFIVMELVEGQTLTGRIGTMGKDPLGLAQLGLAAVQGLREAHAHGVVHGDIKPENLMVLPDGRLKILDFGVSRLLASELDTIRSVAKTLRGVDPASAPVDERRSFETGLVAGTLAYMPPEQMRGDPIDGRADLYSLAVVLQQLATGRVPFEAPSPIAVMARALSADSATVEQLADTLPPELTRLLSDMLSGSRSDRPSSAAEAEVDFQMAIAALEERAKPRAGTGTVVAVLPFEMLAGADDDDFLRLALAQAVAHGLAGQPGLSVRPTSAVTRYLEESPDPGRVATDLGAQVVIEGTIQRLGPSLRVQAQAWDAEAGSTIVSVKHDAVMDELFGLQDRLARDLSRSLGTEREATAGARPSEPDPERRHPEAYELYLRAGERLLRWSDYDVRTAMEQLKRSVALDPEFSDAWARLAGAQSLMAIYFEPTDDWYHAAEASVDRALQLDPGNPEAWASRGRILWTPRAGFRNEEALRYLGAACRHHAPPQDGLQWNAGVLAHVGLHEESEYWVRRALERQPDDELARLVLGELIAWRGDFEEGVEHYARLLAMNPNSIFAQLWYPVGLTYVGELDDAEQAIEKARGSFGDDAMFYAIDALIAALHGNVEGARERIQTSLDFAKSVSHQHHAWHHAAAAAATIGDSDTAVRLLRRAAKTGFPNYPAFLADPHFESLGSIPAFADFMTEMESSWRHLSDAFNEVRA